MGKKGGKGGALNFKKAVIDHNHLVDKLKEVVKNADTEHPLWLHDYEWLGKSCAPRLMSLYQMQSLLSALVDVCPELSIKYCDLKFALQHLQKNKNLHQKVDFVTHVADKLITVQKHMRELKGAPEKIDEADIPRYAKKALWVLLQDMETVHRDDSSVCTIAPFSVSGSPLSSPRRANSETSLLSIRDAVDPENPCAEPDLSQSSDITLDSDGFPDFREAAFISAKKQPLPPTKKALHKAFGIEKNNKKDKKDKKDKVQRKPAASEKVVKKTKWDDQAKSKKKIPSSSPWKLMHSKIYSKERAKRFLEHGDDEKAKRQASKACAAAKLKWDKGELEGN